MKIETIDMVAPEPEPTRPEPLDRGIVVRSALVVVMTWMFLVALNWALNVTNANARQVSTSLSGLQERLDQPGRSSGAAHRSHGAASRTGRANDGPILEPADDR
jgi:hypothetical protein